MQKYCRAGQVSDDKTAHVPYMMDKWGHRHTFRICNTYWVSTATMVTRTLLNVTLHVHSPSCNTEVLSRLQNLVFYLTSGSCSKKKHQNEYVDWNTKPKADRENYTVRYNWINQLSNTTIWWLDMCCLLHRYQLHVSALIAIFRLNELTTNL